jgi:hypothetical protein
MLYYKDLTEDQKKQIIEIYQICLEIIRNNMSAKKYNLIDREFGRLRVIDKAPNIIGGIKRKRSHTAWLCSCKCGNTKVVRTAHLIHENVQSCGCLGEENYKSFGQKTADLYTKYSALGANVRSVWGHRYNEIPFEDFYTQSQQKCFYCGILPSNIGNKEKYHKGAAESRKNSPFIYNGLDRLDSTKTHTIDNVVPACPFCNWGKLDKSMEEFDAWIKRVHEYRFGIKVASEEDIPVDVSVLYKQPTS